MVNAEQLLISLEAEVLTLEKKFLSSWLPAQPDHEPADFQHDVKAYCVLTHAAFEEFVESISTLAASATMSSWLAKKNYLGTQAILLSYGFKPTIEEDESKGQDRYFDQIRAGLKDCIDKHSKALEKNHGFSLKYLRSVLTPVGIDVPEDLSWQNSLSELTEARGSYAHKIASEAKFGRNKAAQRPMTPEKAKSVVQGCLELCKEVKDRHEKALPA